MTPALQPDNRPIRILIVRVSSLGDVVHNMPILADIHHHFPNAIIDWVVEEAYVDLVRLNGHVHKIIPFSLRRWRKKLLSKPVREEIRRFLEEVQQEPYDFVFDTQGLLKTGIVMGFAKLRPAGKKVGLANATEGSGYEAISRIFHNHSIPVGARTHAVTRGRLVAAAALGYELDSPADFDLHIPDLQADWLPAVPYAVFFHGTARKEKKWSEENWIAAGHVIAKHGLMILLPWGSENELKEAELLSAKIPGAQLLPRLSIPEAVLLAARARLVVGVDTGLTHIGAAFCRPTIELYCDSPRWKTEGTWSENIINLGDTGASPSPEEVEDAIHSLLLDKTDA